MQMDEAARLQREWREKGSPPCDHPQFASEFYLGTRTGDKVCTKCGEDFSSAELRAMGH
jgi:hypothetical protein